MTVELKNILDLEKWEKLQESLALSTRLAIILVDYKGRPVTKHSQVQPFCQLVRHSPELSKLCEKCDARGGLEAVRTGQPFIYRCHFNIVDMAIPIIVDDQDVGAIMAGEVLLEDHQEELEQVLTMNDAFIQEFLVTHQELYQQYPVLELADLEKSATLIADLSQYIISEAIKKDYLINTYKQSLQISSRKEELEPLNMIQKDIQQTLLTAQLTPSSAYQTKNKQLQPVLDALWENKSLRLNLQELADLVHLTPTYLSRLLKEEFGIPFSQFYRQLKITWAKQLLLETDKTIAQISEDLGFVEDSYFVRIFKQETGETPLKYRKRKNRA